MGEITPVAYSSSAIYRGPATHFITIGSGPILQAAECERWSPAARLRSEDRGQTCLGGRFKLWSVFDLGFWGYFFSSKKLLGQADSQNLPIARFGKRF